MLASRSKAVAKRLVFLFPGFEPLSAAQHADRFCRGAAQSAKTWGVDLEISPAQPGSETAAHAGRLPVLPIAMSGEGWRTETDLVICDWGDLILDYARRGTGTRLADGIRALADFIATGTFFRYCRVSWRYALFFLYPLLSLAFAAAFGLAVASSPALLGWSGLHYLWSLPLGALAAVGAGMLIDRRLHLMTALDDWAFARDLCRGRNPDIEARIAEQGDAIAARLSQCAAEEILIAAHSLGASLAVVALGNALAQHDPPCPVHLLTVGSSLMKTAFHPSAGLQRAAVRALVVDHRLHWMDVQAVSDPINFYRSNPALSLGIREGRTPVERRISLRDMVSPQTYRRIKRNFFRLHRQFVFGVERRNSFSFHMILLGPIAFERFVEARDINLPPLAAPDAAGPGRTSRAAAR